MKKYATIFAVLAMAVCISSTVASAADTKAAKEAKAAKPAKAAKSQPIMLAVAPLVAPAASVFATLTETTLSLSGIGLTPGTRYAYTFEVWTVGAANSYTRGGSDGTTVRSDGTYTVSMDIADLKGWAGTGGLDKVIMWFRPLISTSNDVSLNADGAPLLVTQSFGV
jgi:hypothetical protein